MAEQFVIVEKRRGVWIWQILLLVMVGCLGAASGYMLGLSDDGYDIDDMVQSRQSLARELSTVKAEYTEARRALIQLERGQAIDAEAMRTARNTISELESRIDGLEADLTFYRNIMAPSEVSTGLQVDQMTLRNLRGEGRYGFKLTLTQIGDNSSFIGGLVAVNLIGERNGEQEVIPLRDVSEDIEELGVRFRFRYFQDVEGVLRLPEDFKPYEIQVVAKAEGAKASQAQRTFDWLQLTE